MKINFAAMDSMAAHGEPRPRIKNQYVNTN